MVDFLHYLFFFAVGVKMTLSQYHQSDYTLTYERTEIVRYNTTYANGLKAHNFKFNRTHAATNLYGNFLVDFGRKMQVEVQAYKFASNEYRQFPIRFAFNFCEAAKKNDFGIQNLYKCGNFTKCPMVKGKHVICNFTPDESHFPPFIPEGAYMLDLKYFYRSVEVQFIQVYGTVKVPVKIPFY